MKHKYKSENRKKYRKRLSTFVKTPRSRIILEIMRTMMWMSQTFAIVDKKTLSELSQKDITRLVFNGMYCVNNNSNPNGFVLKCWYCSKCFINWIDSNHVIASHDCNWTETIKKYISL